jgi:PAS domain S-box-containing protein
MAGFVLWQWYSNIIAYILTGIAVSAVVYKIYSDLMKEKDALQGEKDRLKLLEDRSRDLLENALDCVFTLDLQGNITSFNRKAEQVSGYSKKDVIGNSLGMFLPPEGIKDFFDKLQRAIRTGAVRRYELEINTIYGKRKFEMNLTAIKSRDKIIGVQGVGRDTTDLKRLEKDLKMAASDLERWSKRTVKKEMTILEMKNQMKAIKKELETHGGRNN